VERQNLGKEVKQMIHVAYRLWGGDGFFAKMLGTSMLSMFENTKEKVTIHIMHNDRLTPDNRGKLCYIAGQYNQRVEFHNVEEIADESLRKFEEAHPILSGINAAWYPCIVHEVFQNLDKLIFLVRIRLSIWILMNYGFMI
jgi:lipopolysaccharide biosynthesis glycosyltransferase